MLRTGFLSLPRDRYWDYVSMLCHCNGANGGTTFTDQKGYTITANGGASTSTAQSKFYGSSYLGGASTDGLQSPNNSAFNFGSQDFTIEMFVRFNASIPTTILIQKASSGQQSYQFYVTSTNFILKFSTDGSYFPIFLSVAHGMSANVWNHIAVSRTGGVCYIFLNGTIKGSAANTDNLFSSNQPLNIFWSGGGAGLVGNGAEVRTTKGIGRYSANFTVPIDAYPDM